MRWFTGARTSSARGPITSGFWETADGTLIANFATRNVVYDSGDAIRHDVLGQNSSNPRTVTVRSRDRGLTWDGADPQYNMMAGPGGEGRGLSREAMPTAFADPVDYLDPQRAGVERQHGWLRDREHRRRPRASRATAARRGARRSSSRSITCPRRPGSSPPSCAPTAAC